MIIRLIALDPHPERGRSDILVYQVPENSRELELLTQLLDEHKIEWTTLTPNPRRKKHEQM
jgi:hypothetical protein